MSDNYLLVIPTKVTWQPDATAAAAVAYVTALYAGPGDSVDEVSCEFYDKVTFIDSGFNTDMAVCPAGGAQVGLEWVFDVVGQRMDDLINLDVVVACCGAVASPNELDHDWPVGPVGFARFEAAVLNGTRAEYALNADELMHVGTLLGHLFVRSWLTTRSDPRHSARRLAAASAMRICPSAASVNQPSAV